MQFKLIVKKFLSHKYLIFFYFHTMFRIFCKTFTSTKIKFHSSLLENTVRVSSPVFGLQTKGNSSYVGFVESKSEIIRSTSNYLKNVLRHDSKYSDLFYKAGALPELENKCESLNIFQKFYENPGGTDLTNLNELLAKELPQLTFDEMLSLMYWFLKCYQKNRSESVWVEISATFNRNLKSVKPKTKIKLFQSFDVFNSLFCKYFRNTFAVMVCRVFRKVNQLTPQEFVLACKYGLVIRGGSKFKIFNHSIDKKFQEVIEDLSMEEINIISAFYQFKGFFFSENITGYILKKLVKNIESPTAFDHQCVMSVLCKKKSFAHPTKDFAEKINNFIPNFNLSSLINLCYLPGFNSSTIKTLTQEALLKCNANFNETSLTTIQRLLEAMIQNNVPDEIFINNCIQLSEKIMEESDSNIYAGFLSKMLFFFVNLQVYPEKLMKTLMTQEFCDILFSKKSTKLVRNWGFAYFTLEIENPELQPQIPLKKLQDVDKVLKYYKSPLTILSTYNSFSYKVEEILSNLYAKDKFFWTRVLPHFLPLCVLRFNKNFEAQEIPAEFKNVSQVGIKKPTDTENYWICIFLENSKTVLGNNEISGFLAAKHRQFNAVGYGIVHVQIKQLPMKIESNVADEFLLEKINSTLKMMAESKSC